MIDVKVSLENKMRYLNVGCGNRYHPHWINIDISPHSNDVIACDISQGIPLPGDSCDVVYHSHVLEHIRRNDSPFFMKECYRVLKPGGILRVATPDLEQICRLYLEKLDLASKGNRSSSYDYDWILLELYDQAVRERRGGDMLGYLNQNPMPNEKFIYSRIGEEGRNIVQNIRRSKIDASCTPQRSHRSRIGKRLLTLVGNLRSKILARLIFGSYGAKAMEIGRFRLAGEVHQWMYDRYSLAELMISAGFQDPVKQSAASSLIPQWTSFNLDTLPDGTVIKPDSLFMEAKKSQGE